MRPHSVPCGGGGHLAFYPQPAVIRNPFSSLLGWYQRRPSKESGLSQLPVVIRPPPPQCRWRPHGTPELPLPHSSKKDPSHLGCQQRSSGECEILPLPVNIKVMYSHFLYLLEWCQKRGELQPNVYIRPSFII